MVTFRQMTEILQFSMLAYRFPTSHSTLAQNHDKDHLVAIDYSNFTSLYKHTYVCIPYVMIMSRVYSV